mmetsp:Transcript_95992/g.271419  ORF Transcript_95992/g.271419 Transcript_95992/m.271419 type:complete len:202 (+) Transcript_95992:487-1092(+)
MYLLSFLFVSSNFSASFFSRSRASSFSRASACFLVGALSSLPFATHKSVRTGLSLASAATSPIFCASFMAACAVFIATSGYSDSVAILRSISTSPFLLPAARHFSTYSFTRSNPALGCWVALTARTTAPIMSATPAVFPDPSRAASSRSASSRPSCGVPARTVASTIIETAAAACGPLGTSLAADRASLAAERAAWPSSMP